MLSALVALLALYHRLQQPVGIFVGPPRITEGDSAVVTWRTGGDSAFIPGFGIVGPTGSLWIHPSGTRRLYMVSGSNGSRVDSATVVVTGAAREGAPHPVAYKASRTYVVPQTNLLALLAAIDSTLQRKFGYPAS